MAHWAMCSVFLNCALLGSTSCSVGLNDLQCEEK